MTESRHRLTPRSDPGLLSLVIPTYNEAAVIPHLRARLTSFAAELAGAVELVFVNDGSSDQTLDLLLDWAAADPRVKVIGLARNFGHQAAATAGLDLARGDAVVLIDADLQDPPEVIHQMLARYRDGYDVVYGVRASRLGETRFKRLTAWLFYRFMRAFIHPDLPADAGDFRLISRPCLDALKTMRETHRFLRGMVAWVGFAQTAVRYDRRAREHGETKYPLRKMLRFAATAAVSFSPAPLRVSLALGFAVAFLGFAVAGYAFLRYVAGYPYVSGWTTLVVLLCLIGGAILISIGVLGEYVGRIYEEIKGRPLYLISTTANLDRDAGDHGDCAS
ncbi:MAG: glycosyltransferase family 2 protein [Candidatus Schekmanbacteria bacterium]|nr:glycosyltransferase family 2 protein [Candidatus Schekmanbacteria bacterium]